jgi:hypothetical protein
MKCDSDNKRWLPQDVKSDSKSKLYLATDGLSAILSLYQATIWHPRQTLLSLSWKLYLYTYVPVIMGRPLWREGEFLIYSCSWAELAQAFSVSSSTRHMTRCYILKFETPSFWEGGGQIPVFISPGKMVDQLHPQALSLLELYKYLRPGSEIYSDSSYQWTWRQRVAY